MFFSSYNSEKKTTEKDIFMNTTVINTTDVIDFFDHLAPNWDAGLVRNDDVIHTILDNAGVCEGADVLDVACGTGVLIPDYLERKAGSVTAIDISSEMVRIAKEKFEKENENVNILCGDVETAQFDRKFDCIVVYNAFPHFSQPERLVKRLADCLKPGGTLTVAHGMSRAKIDHRHSGSASKVSRGLMSEEELADLFETVLSVTEKISDERMYQVAGVKNKD